jgi:HD-GYP domain-containing protein (c-di-GMP phosphodiesterase class II)
VVEDRSVVVEDTETDPVFEPWREAAEQHGFRSCAAFPVRVDGIVSAVLAVYAGEAGVLHGEVTALLSELAADLGFALGSIEAEDRRTRTGKALRAERAPLVGRPTVVFNWKAQEGWPVERQRHRDQSRRSLEEAVAAIAATVEAPDSYTAGHQRRVAALAAGMAKELGLAEEEVQGIHLAGTIHDLGKIRIPAEILARPGELSEIETRLIQIHPEVGWEILKGVELPWPIAEMVLEHHERLDGSGYPKGLRGVQISQGARIIAVADVVEAMASDRPYRPSRGLDAALSQIEGDRAVLFDAAAVDACLALFRVKGYRLEE